MKKFWGALLLFFALSLVSCEGKAEISESASEASAVTSTVQTTIQTTIQTTAQTTVSTTTTAKAVITAPVEEIDSETAFEYEYGKNNLKSPERDSYWLRSFGKRLTAGNTPDGKNRRFTEMYYGISAYIEGSEVYYKYYSNFDCGIKATGLSLISDENSETLAISSEYQSLNMANAENGLYMMSAEFDNDYVLSLGIYIDNNDVWLCSVEDIYPVDMEYHLRRRRKIQKLLLKYEITPENSLNVHEFCYPYYESSSENSKCDVKEWAEFSYSLVSPDWSDEKKLLAFYQWITENMSYDHYCTEKDEYRYDYYNDYSGQYNAYSTHTGVCFDFSAILIIMCRANGIPANMIETKTHGWALVYINDVWREIDPTADVYKHVYGEDPNDITTDRYVQYFGYMHEKTDFLTETQKLKTINRGWRIFFEPCEEVF